MLYDVTQRNFEDRFQSVQSKAKDTVQSAHCALKKRSEDYQGLQRILNEF